MISSVINDIKNLEIYLENFTRRFTYTSISLEYENELIKSKKIKNHYKAINCLIGNSLEKNKIYPHEIQNVNKEINKEISFIKEGYRTVDVIVNGMNFDPPPAKKVYFDMMGIIDSYNHIWKDLDCFEKEAMLHINLVRTQPFEDGNKRTARIITASNLIKNNVAPPIIRREELDEYIKYVDNNDHKGFSIFLQNKSAEELERIKSLVETNTFKDNEKIKIKSQTRN